MYQITGYNSSHSTSSTLNKEYYQEINNEKPTLHNFVFMINEDINKLRDAREERIDELNNVKIKLAKKQFFINVIELTVSLASFAVSVGVTVCSGGVTAPIAAITGLNLMLSISNLACAYHNWSCASKNKDELAMGSDAMQQAVFMLAEYCQASPESAKKIARYTSYLIRVGMVVSLGMLGVFIQPAVYDGLCLLAKNYIPILSSMLSMITSGALGVWINNHNDEREIMESLLTENKKEIVKKSAYLDGFNDAMGLLLGS
ncbi:MULTISPECIES: hypothetical protein [Yersinia]|uniref:hypothetical protein n=1 Tax=Yersinia TaxID=629 RepID=UPI0005E0303D|nr:MULTISPECIES: hypothetical protein [Yersinia]OVZ95773.1 hypothetical protein CBW53_18875 [Yersinia frederiksenii]CNI63270.1 secretion system effector protein SseF [Yersinia frederiksenii]CNJ24889.1 secretion system effector protein SseF [Yersinia frederiksenii]